MHDRLLRSAFGGRATPATGTVAGDRDLEDWIRQRTRDVLHEFTDDERLVSVLSAQWGYYGADPGDSTFAIHALVTRHFWNGGYYPRGGSAAIAQGLLQTVAEAGGWTRVGASVADLVMRDGAVVGVRLDDGEEIAAGQVVSAVGGVATVQHLLPPEIQAQDWAREVARLEPSPAHLCLHLGFEGDIRDAGASGANRWFFETWSHTLDQWHLDDVPDPIPILYTSFPSLKDPDHDPGPRQRHTGAVVTFVPHDDFERFFATPWRGRGAEYEAIKADLSERILRQLLRHMPALGPMVRYTELSTPLTTTHFTRSTKGAIYGIKPTPARFLTPGLRPRSPVPGLFLSGTDVATVGVMGACLGGVLTASAIDPLKAMRILRTVR
jgi:all-trans-retinol 13,14-reductase